MNGNPVYNIGKRGQEILKTVYSIYSITKEYYKSIIS